MGIGALIVRGAVIIGTGGLLYTTVLNPIMGRISDSNAVVEQGFFNPKDLDIQRKKNAADNIEGYLQYKNGEETGSLPCMKGPSGPLCGTVEYWWDSIGTQQREGLAVGEWPAISNEAKHGILSSELQALIDTAYGTQNGSQKTPAQQQYGTTRQK